jgi:hypothetical protein
MNSGRHSAEPTLPGLYGSGVSNASVSAGRAEPIDKTHLRAFRPSSLSPVRGQRAVIKGWGHIELVKLLLSRGAPAHEVDAEPWATPIAWARKMNQNAILLLLEGWSGQGRG